VETRLVVSASRYTNERIYMTHMSASVCMNLAQRMHHMTCHMKEVREDDSIFVDLKSVAVILLTLWRLVNFEDFAPKKADRT